MQAEYDKNQDPELLVCIAKLDSEIAETTFDLEKEMPVELHGDDRVHHENEWKSHRKQVS